ncbi:MAG: DUF2799 domain-containing protein [Bdellovibrionales bacterium]|nr:DUF2799 domain-containing protein [Bdellovibrionales bacterium]
MYRFSFLLSLVLLFLSGCAHEVKQACNEVDWYEIGRNDGAVGRTEDYFQNYESYCPSGKIDRVQVLYFHGREAGLSSYCDPKNAFELGHSGKIHDHVCPLEYQNSFLLHYNRGLEYRKIEETNLALTKELRQIRSQLTISNLNEQVRADLKKKIDSLENKLQLNNGQLSKIEGTTVTR